MSVYSGETGWSAEAGLQEWELGGEWEAPASQEWESEGEGAFEAESYEGEWQGEGEESEIQLAQELLEITTEQELDQFLGKLVRGAGKFLKSGVGKSVVGVLRNVAKTALPVVGSAVGSFVAPGIGTAIGGKLGSMASKLLEVQELEMLGEAEAEFEAARRFVRFGRATARYAAAAPGNVPPNVVARSAAVTAARRYAPALVRGGAPNWRSRRDQRWAAARPGYQSYRPRRRRRRPVRRPWPPASYGYAFAPWAATLTTDYGQAPAGWSAGDNGFGGDPWDNAGAGGYADDDDQWSGFEF